jgi:hypothetical protein
MVLPFVVFGQETGKTVISFKDSLHFGYIVTGSEIKRIPLRDMEDFFSLLPGVVRQDRQFHFRGSRMDEIGYYLEGASVRDVMTGENLVTVIPEALDYFQIQSGAIDAEFGNAVGGRVVQFLRSGTDEYRGALNIATDAFATQNQRFLDTYSYGYSDYTATLHGPIPGFRKKVKFFLAGQNQFFRDHRRAFWEGLRFQNLVDSGRRGGTPGDSIDLLEIKPGNIPQSYQNRWTGNGSLEFEFDPVKIRLIGAFTFQRNQDNLTPIQHIFNLGRIPLEDRSNGLISLNVLHQLNPKLNYKIQLDYFDFRGKRYDPLLHDDYLLYADSLANAAFGYVFRSYTSNPLDYDLYGFPFDRPGKVLTNYSKFKQNFWQAHFRLQHALKNNEIALGGDFQRYTLRYYNISPSVLSFIRQDPDWAHARPGTAEYEKFIDRWFRRSQTNVFGYDAFGNEINSGFDGAKHPQFGALYFQDRFRAERFLFEAGLRLALFDLNDRRLKNPTNPETQFTPTLGISPSAFEDVGWKARWSPRVGLIFSLSDQTTLCFTAAKFFQAPPLRLLYVGRGYLNRVFYYDASPVPDPVGYDLDPVATVQYEVGGHHAVSRYFTVEATAFYRKTKNQIQLARIVTEQSARAHAYDIYKNGDESTSKGFEMQWTLRRTKRVAAWVNYTFQDAEGGPILERMGLNFLFTFNSGHPYTLTAASIGDTPPHLAGLSNVYFPYFNKLLGPPNSSRTDCISEFNLRLDKTMTIHGLDLTFYSYVQNLLNSKNVINVYERTGNAYTDGFLSDPSLSGSNVQDLGPRFVEMYRAINLTNRQHLWALENKDVFGTPREIRFGVRIEY